MNRPAWPILLMLVLVLAGLGLRVAAAMRPGLWGDEIFLLVHGDRSQPGASGFVGAALAWRFRRTAPGATPASLPALRRAR